MRAFVIVNPAAGGGKAGRRWPRIINLLKNAVGSFEHAMTGNRGDAANLARDAIASGAELVISVGGDGTANEVLNGFALPDGKVSQTCALAIVPCGTGSDFMRGLGCGAGFEPAIERLCRQTERRIDVGRVEFNNSGSDGKRTGRLFLNSASFGFSGTVCHNMARSKPAPFLPARIAYLMATLGALRSFRAVRVRFTVEGKDMDKEIMLAAVANGRYFGAGMEIAPEADIQDGLLDVVVLRPMSKLRLIGKIRHVYRGTHVDLPEVEMFRASTIAVALADSNRLAKIYVETDGEIAGTLGSEFSVERRALRLAQ